MQGVSVIQHWAVKVGDTWYEIERGDTFEDKNIVIKTRGEVSRTGACYYGSESVGWTDKSWEEIDKFTEDWIDAPRGASSGFSSSILDGRVLF